MKVKRKPLSVLLTFCMVLALVPMAALAESGNTVSIATVEQLEAAIENQADDQVWELAAGTYELSKTFTTVSYTHLDVYKRQGLRRWDCPRCSPWGQQRSPPQPGRRRGLPFPLYWPPSALSLIHI